MAIANNFPATDKPTAAAAAARLAAGLPRLGEQCRVLVAPGLLVPNTEAGRYFAEGEVTPQTVTATTLRRLQDGDLWLAAPGA